MAHAGFTGRPCPSSSCRRRLRVSSGDWAELPASASVGILVCCEGAGFATDSTRHRYAMRTGFTMMVLPDTTVAFDATSELPLSFSRQVRSKPARIES